METLNTMLTFAQVSETSSVGATFIGWIILIGICCGIYQLCAGIYNACTKPREFGITMSGQIKEKM